MKEQVTCRFCSKKGDSDSKKYIKGYFKVAPSKGSPKWSCVNCIDEHVEEAVLRIKRKRG